MNVRTKDGIRCMTADCHDGFHGLCGGMTLRARANHGFDPTPCECSCHAYSWPPPA